MIYYCLECGTDCGEHQHCCVCESNPNMLHSQHPGFESDAEIDAEIAAEEFWEDYTS